MLINTLRITLELEIRKKEDVRKIRKQFFLSEALNVLTTPNGTVHETTD